MDSEDCGRERLLKDLKKKAEKGEAKLQVINGPFTPLHHPSPSPLFPEPERAKRGNSILRGQLYKRINNEILLRLLTVLSRKVDLKIALTGAP